MSPSALIDHPSNLTPPPAHTTSTLRQRTPLVRYRDPDGIARELVLLDGAEDSGLLVDQMAHGLGDRRLIAHLGADEPAGNAELLCRIYLADRSHGCRRLAPADFDAAPLEPPRVSGDPREVELSDAQGRSYRLQVIPAGRHRQLRWTRRDRAEQAWKAVTLREVVGAIEDYDPALPITRAAIAAQSPGGCVSVLASDLGRVEGGSTVLNRALREAVLRMTATHRTTMSEIATRCGRIKRGRTGNISGDTSWLARRTGLRPDVGSKQATPWVRHDVLALIARNGLGIAPGEAEVGTTLSARWWATR